MEKVCHWSLKFQKPPLFPDHFLFPACTLSCELSWAEDMDQQLIVPTALPEGLGSILSPQNSHGDKQAPVTPVPRESDALF